MEAGGDTDVGCFLLLFNALGVAVGPIEPIALSLLDPTGDLELGKSPDDITSVGSDC